METAISIAGRDGLASTACNPGTVLPAQAALAAWPGPGGFQSPRRSRPCWGGKGHHRQGCEHNKVIGRAKAAISSSYYSNAERHGGPCRQLLAVRQADNGSGKARLRANIAFPDGLLLLPTIGLVVSSLGCRKGLRAGHAAGRRVTPTGRGVGRTRGGQLA